MSDRVIRRCGDSEYAIEGYPEGKFFVGAVEAHDLCEGTCRGFLGHDRTKPYVPGRSPESVALTPEVMRCLRDGGFFKPRKEGKP